MSRENSLQLNVFGTQIQVTEKEKLNLNSLSILKGAEILKTKITDRKRADDEKQRLLEFLVLSEKNMYNSLICNVIKNYLNNLERLLRNSIKLYKIKVLEVKLQDRGVFGIGSIFGQIPFEVGLFFHPYFNVPYIPGSTIKGAALSACYMLNQQQDACEQVFEGIIGKGDKKLQVASPVVFLDALPIEAGENEYLLYPDVITPHYPNAETEKDVKPNPIIYLTVAPGTVFRTYVLINKARDINIDNLEGILDRSIIFAFMTGVGAKTSLGYSRFEVKRYDELK